MMDLASEDALLTFSFTACKLKWSLGTVNFLNVSGMFEQLIELWTLACRWVHH